MGEKVVRMPNGDLVRFGDEFDDAEIKALIEHKFPDFGQQFAQAPVDPAAASEAASNAVMRAQLSGVPFLGGLASGVGAMDAMTNNNVTPEMEASGDWTRGMLAPVTVGPGGEMRPAWPQLAVDAGRAFTLPQDVLSGETPFDPRVAMADQDPETLNRANTLATMAGTTPGMAAKGMVPASMRDLVLPDGTKLPKMIADDLERSGLTPEQVNKRLAEIGPEALLGDLSTNLQGRLAAIANLPGRGQDKIMKALMGRKEGANERIKAALGDTFGEAPVPHRVEAEIAAAKKVAGEGYAPVFREKALSENFEVDAKPIADAIDAMSHLVVGKTRQKVESVKGMLVDPRTGEYTKDPEIIMAVRQELDGLIGAETNANTKRVLSDLRKVVDIDLGTSVPGLKDVDARYQEQALQNEAFDYGRTVLRNGDSPIHPEELADKVLAGTSGQTYRIQQGMIADIARIVGTTANDRIAMKQILKGEGSWNREKLVTAFGEKKAKALIDLFDNEALMAATEDLALSNSKTARILGAQEGIRPGAGEKGVIRALLNTDFADALLAAGNKVTGGALKGVREGRNSKIADALLSGGGLRLQGRAAKNGPGLLVNPAVEAALIDALLNRDKKTKAFAQSLLERSL